MKVEVKLDGEEVEVVHCLFTEVDEKRGNNYTIKVRQQRPPRPDEQPKKADPTDKAVIKEAPAKRGVKKDVKASSK